MQIISNKNLINHMYRNLPNIIKPTTSDKILNKFIFMFE